jgi:hypothetical protein
VQAALDEARSNPSPASTLVARLPEDATSSLRGRAARLAVVKARYDGFEPVERLLVIAVLAGEVAALPLDEAELLLRTGTFAAASDATDRAVPDDVFDDVVDEHVEDLQREVGGSEQKRFDRALVQLDRFMEDRLLLVRRRAAQQRDELEAAEKRRDIALGPEARSAGEKAAVSAQRRVDATDAEIARLTERDDPAFRRSREKTLARRYAAPVLERLFDVNLVIK